GDVEFQRKCLGKMQDVAGRGRTVLVVSHNANAIKSLCSRALFLEKGRMLADADVETTMSLYENQAGETTVASFESRGKHPSILRVEVDAEALAKHDLVVDIAFSSPFPMKTRVGRLSLRAPSGVQIWSSSGRFSSRVDATESLSSGVL